MTDKQLESPADPAERTSREDRLAQLCRTLMRTPASVAGRKDTGLVLDRHGLPAGFTPRTPSRPGRHIPGHLIDPPEGADRLLIERGRRSP
jgi:hypothetical protein